MQTTSTACGCLAASAQLELEIDMYMVSPYGTLSKKSYYTIGGSRETSAEISIASGFATDPTYTKPVGCGVYYKNFANPKNTDLVGYPIDSIKSKQTKKTP